MKKTILIVCVAAVCGVAGAQSPSFQGIGNLPNSRHSMTHAISANGEVVAASSSQNSGGVLGALWTQSGGIVPIAGLDIGGTMTPYGISGDGMVAAGYKNGRPLAWTQTGGVVDLGDLGASYGAARGVSADGTIIIGESSVLASNGFGWGPISFRWTASDGMVAIDPNDGPAGAGTYSSANAISADGSTVAGRTSRFRTSGSGPYLWTESGGMIDLGYLDDASSYGSAYACSSDGAVVAGMNNSTLGNQAFRWTEALGMQGLGDLTGGDFESHAYGVSGDGTVIIGKGTTAIGDEAFIWDEVNGMRNLKTVLTDDFGLDLTGWTLLSAEGISADGNSIVGYGLNPSGMREGWVAVTPEPATLALLAMGAVAMLRRRKGGMSR